MATATLSFQKRARNPFSSPAWESSYTTSTGTNLLGDVYYAISYRFSPYTGSDVQSVSNIVFKAVLDGDWSQDCTYKLYLYSQDPAGYSSQPSNYLTSTSGTKASNTNVIQWTIAGSYASNSTLYILIIVDYGSGQVTLNHGSSSLVETYTAKALPQIAFGSIAADANGMKIPIINGSNYSLTCVITAGNTTTPGNNAELYRGTSSTGQFNVSINAVQWFNAANVTTSLSIPITISVTGNSPNSLSGNGTYTESRQASINSMKPAVGSPSTQIQQAAGAATQYYPNTYIAGYSKCKVTATITRPTNAAVSTVRLSYPGGATVTMQPVSGSSNTYAATTSAALAQNTTFTVTVTDVRGLSNSNTVSVTGVVAYVLPSVTIDTANTYRCNSQGVKTNGGDYYRIKVTAQINTSLPNNAITELTVGQKGASAAQRHNISSGTTSSAFGTLSDPKKAYVLTIIIQDKISGQITREYTLKGKQRDLVLNHDGGHTHLGVGTTPVGKEVEQYKDTIELPQDGLFMLGGIPVQAFNYPYIGNRTSDNPCFGRDFRNISADRTGEANAAALFGFSASQYSSWSNVPTDPLDQQSAGIMTKGWIGWREVYFANQDIVLVKIIEIAPVAGRIWFCSRAKSSSTGAYTWTSWRYLMPTSV